MVWRNDGQKEGERKERRRKEKWRRKGEKEGKEEDSQWGNERKGEEKRRLTRVRIEVARFSPSSSALVSTTPVYSTSHQPCYKEEEQRWPTSPSLEDPHSVRGLQARRHFLLHTLGLPTLSVLHLQGQVELTIYLVGLAPVSHCSVRLKVKAFLTTLFSILLQAGLHFLIWVQS